MYPCGGGAALSIHLDKIICGRVHCRNLVLLLVINKSQGFAAKLGDVVVGFDPTHCSTRRWLTTVDAMVSKSVPIQREDRPAEPALPKRRAGRPSLTNAKLLNDRILAAARRIFIERGFADTSIELVAQEAGTSWRSVGDRYADRHALLVAVTEETCRTQMADVLPKLTEGHRDDPLDRLRLICWRLMKAALDGDNAAFSRVVFGECGRCPPLADMIMAYNNSTEKQIAVLVENLQKNCGRFLDQDSAPIVAAVMGMMYTIPLNHAILQDPLFADPSRASAYFERAWGMISSLS